VKITDDGCVIMLACVTKTSFDLGVVCFL